MWDSAPFSKHSWGLLSCLRLPYHAGPLVRGFRNGNRAGLLLRLVHVLYAATGQTRTEIGEYLWAVYRRDTASGQNPCKPHLSSAVQSTLLSAARSETDITRLGTTLRYLRDAIPGLPDTAPLVAATADSVLKDWAVLQPGTGGLNQQAVRLVAHAPYLSALAAFFCEVQPGCVSVGSTVDNVTGAMLLDALVGHRGARAAFSAALGALNREMISRTQTFLSGSSAPYIFDGSEDAAGFKLTRLSIGDAVECAEVCGIAAIQGADAILVSQGRSPLQPTVTFFVKAASREVLCVLESRGLLTTAVPMPTVRAMLAHSAVETFRGCLTAQLSLARKTNRDRAAAAAAAVAVDYDDADADAEDGKHVVDVDESEMSVDTPGTLSPEARQACQYAATRMSPPAAPSTLASLAHLLHVLHTYRDYTPCRHVAEDFKPDWFHRHAIVADSATTNAVTDLLGSPPGLLGGYRGAWVRDSRSPETACASGCSCSCHQQKQEANADPSVTLPKAALTLQRQHDTAFERSELPVNFCPSCKGAAVPVALVFDSAGSNRVRRAPATARAFDTVSGAVPSSDLPVCGPSSTARDVLRAGLLSEPVATASPPALCHFDVASPHCTHFLLDLRTLGPCSSRRKQCSHCALLSRGASREASEVANETRSIDLDGLEQAVRSAENDHDAVFECGPVDVNACSDVAVLKAAVNRLVIQQTRQRRLAAAREEVICALQKDVLELRQKFAGAAAGDDDLDVPIDLCALEAEDVALVLGSDACKEFIDNAVPDALTRLIYRNMVQIALSKSPHASNGLRYDPLDILLANSIRLRSPAAYDQLRALGVNLPSNCTLDGATVPLQGHSGYIPERVALFKRGLKAAGIPLNVPLTVSIDGLSLRAGLWYSPSRRSVAGYAYVWSDDISPAIPAAVTAQRAPPPSPADSGGPAVAAPAKQPYRSAFEGLLATHAEVVIIRDASGRHSTSVGFYPLESENGQALTAIVLEVVQLLTESGLNPACIAWDGGAGNRAAWCFLTGAVAGHTLPLCGAACPAPDASVDDIVNGIHCSFINPADPKRRVYIVFDPEHVLKRHRNALLNSRPDLGQKSFSWQFPTGPVEASWDHVRKAYHRDQAEAGGQRHCFLSHEAVFLTHAGLLNVGYASAATGDRLISWLRELGQREDVSTPAIYKTELSSRPPSPSPSAAGGGAAGGAANATGTSDVPFEGFVGNPYRASYTYLRTCRIIFDGTFQPVFIRSAANPGLRAAWGAAVSLVNQAAEAEAAGRGFISHQSVSDPLVTCASFYGIMRDYVEPLVAKGSIQGLYGRALASTTNERYYGEMRGGRSAGFASGAMSAGTAARCDAQLSVHAGGEGVCTAQVRGSNVLSFWDTGHNGVLRPAGDDDTAKGTALSLRNTVALLHPPHSAASARAASERTVCIRSYLRWISVSGDPSVPKQRLRFCKYIQGPECTVLSERVQQSPLFASWTSVWHGLLGEGSTVQGYAALLVSRCGPGTAHLTSDSKYRVCLDEMLKAGPQDQEPRMGPNFMMQRKEGGDLVSVDAVPVIYTAASELIFQSWHRRGVSRDLLHRPSLLMITLIERMIEVVQPLLTVKAVVNARAAYVQRLEAVLMADSELRRLAHFTFSGVGCGPIGAEPRKGEGSEDVAYEFLAGLVGPFVLGQWQRFRCTRLAHEISAVEEDVSSKEGFIATLRSKAAALSRRAIKAEEREKHRRAMKVAPGAAGAEGTGGVVAAGDAAKATNIVPPVAPDCALDAVSQHDEEGAEGDAAGRDTERASADSRPLKKVCLSAGGQGRGGREQRGGRGGRRG